MYNEGHEDSVSIPLGAKASFLPSVLHLTMTPLLFGDVEVNK